MESQNLDGKLDWKQIRNLWQQTELLKQGKNMRIRLDKLRKVTGLEQKIQLEEINQKVLAKKKRKLKRYRYRAKWYRQNRTFQNNERKFYLKVGGEWAKTYKQLDAREAKRFCSKIWERRDHNKNAGGINNMEKELQILKVSKVCDRSREWPESSLFDSYHTKV